MNTGERLRALKEFAYEAVCKGRKLKTQGIGDRFTADDYLVEYKEPECFVGLYPRKADNGEADPYRMAPSILILPGPSKACAEIFKKDSSYRNDIFGAELSVQFLFCTYDPGRRKGNDGIDENTENAVYTLTTWMDDLQAYLMGNQIIKGSDLCLMPESMSWTLLNQDNVVADMRPNYFGYVQATFRTYVNRKNNEELEKILI